MPSLAGGSERTASTLGGFDRFARPSRGSSRAVSMLWDLMQRPAAPARPLGLPVRPVILKPRWAAWASLPARVLAGMTTVPSLIAASITSHRATWLPSSSRIRSPRTTPCARSQAAVRSDRSRSPAKVNTVSRSTVPSASRSTTRRPTAWLSSASTSNQSRAQLKCSPSGRGKARAASRSPRVPSRWSRAARNSRYAAWSRGTVESGVMRPSPSCSPSDGPGGTLPAPSGPGQGPVASRPRPATGRRVVQSLRTPRSAKSFLVTGSTE
ncbi:hypothetical protein ABH941_006662 [Streptacidiphilus sp. EB103A]